MLLFILVGLSGGTAHAQEAEPSAPDTADSDEAARDLLLLARLHYNRGEFARAVEAFGRILSTPVRLRSRQDLHEGFLYYAFTLFLQGESALAEEKLQLALRLDPEFAPSPVTTRPDLLAFYIEVQEVFIDANGSTAAPPETIFPELQKEPGGIVVRRRRFAPVFGIGLRQLGHPKLGDFLLSTEIVSASLNVASIILRIAVWPDITPAGWTATSVGRGVNYATFGIFWAAAVVDLIVSLSLQRTYRLHPERRRPLTVRSRGRAPAPPRVEVDGGAIALRFW